MTYHGIADVHLGNHRVFGGEMVAGLNQRARDTLEVLGNAALGRSLIVAGDLFDVACPSPQMLAGAMTALENARRCWLLVGNHDQESDALGHHALAPLACADLDVRERTSYWGRVVFVPFRNAPAVEYIQEELRQARWAGSAGWDDALLVIHAGIEDETAPKFLRGAHDSIHIDALFALMEEHDIQAVFAGNWHNHKRWERGGREVCQIGALVPTGFDNPGLDEYGGVACWDSDLPPGKRISWDSLPGPRFIKATSVQQLRDQLDEALGRATHVYAQLDCAMGERAEANRVLEALKADPDSLLRDFRVRAHRKSVAKAIETAARAARDSETQEAALADYVARMPLDSDLDRNRILAICRDALAAG